MPQTPQPEFSRPLELAKVAPEGAREEMSATAAERRALAGRMRLPTIRALRARLEIRPEGKGRYRVKGEMQATIDQECVRTLEVFTSEIRAPVERVYTTAAPAGEPPPREIEIDPLAEEEPEPAPGGVADLGELVAETLALSLDPWPKKPGTTFVDYHAGEDEPGAEAPSAFAPLKALKDAAEKGKKKKR